MTTETSIEICVAKAKGEAYCLAPHTAAAAALFMPQTAAIQPMLANFPSSVFLRIKMLFTCTSCCSEEVNISVAKDAATLRAKVSLAVPGICDL